MLRRQVPRDKSSTGSFVRYLNLYIIIVSIVVCFVVFKLVRDEVRTSKYQARYLSSISEQLGFKLASGPSTSIRYPEYGPYDQRLGYTLLPEVIKRLENAGFVITSQAAFSPMMSELADYGLFNIYHEKTQAGLRITDKDDQVVFNAVYPAYGYPSFKSVPPLIMDTLLFIENRELLSEEHTTVNPAIEWDRLGFAGIQLMAHKLGATHALPGGSTLATQMEKYRHSKNGYTNSILDKFRQMGTASLRAYMMGPDTLEMRQEIALSYLNSMPLAATPKLGEIHGLGDGLSGWFGSDFAEVNKLLSPEALKPPRRISDQQAIAYRQVLNIFLSQRRPSYLLGRGYDALQKLTDSYLRVMTEQGIVSPALRDAALQVTTVRPLKVDSLPVQYFTQKKTQNVLRARLAKTLGVKSNYDLDRLDLTVKTTLDYNTQQAVTSALKLLSQPDRARVAGILGFRMLNENTDLAPIVYSLMLFEKGDTGNLLRIQTDNYDQPLDINEGIRLDLGSTSKLRTMVHYLELVTDVYEQYKGLSPQELSKIDIHPRDYISAWVIEQLKHTPKINLEDLLNLALDKRFSAGPGEYFFTGGGLHHFNNFTEDENNKIMSVRNALRDSVNLVFIRLMREVVYHHLYKPDGIARWLESPDNPKRKEYLQRFADNEGQVYLNRFYARYKSKSADEALEMLTKRVFAKPSRFTMLYRSIYPEKDEMALNAFLNSHLGKDAMVNEDIYELYDKYSIEKFDLQDQGYITKIHPLELWLVGYLVQHPNATRKEVVAASFEQRQGVYRWLFKNHRRFAQQQRIMTLLEAEAFKDIHTAWKRVGYPFEALTPSYATAIGASGDRPAALAELTGILLNNGIRKPVVRFESLHYAQGTPYETIMKKAPTKGERIFAPEIAKVARGALVGVVEGGTAGRLNGVYTDAEGSKLSVGGKTGTGDHRKQIWGAGGSLIESKFISRAATFTFFIGERFFGVITAYVEGENSGLYHFTSSLPVQIVKFLKPTLSPLINNTLPVKQVTPPVVNVLMTENSKPAVKPVSVKVTKPLIEKTVVKIAKPPVENPVVKVAKPPIENPVVKVAKPPVENAVVKAAKPPVENAVVKVAKSPVENAVVKVAKPPVDNTVVKVTKPLIEKPVVKIAPPLVEKPLVQAPKPLTEKPVVKLSQPLIEKPVVNLINPLVTPTTVKPITKTIESKTTKNSGSQKITTTDRNDSATRYYKYPTTTTAPAAASTQ